MTYPHRRVGLPLSFMMLALSACITVVGCADFEFGQSVLGGDAADDLTVKPDVEDVHDATLDVEDRIDAEDVIDVSEVGDGGCTSNANCRDPMLPVCDTATQRCVQCTAAMDRCPRGQYCNPTTSACTDGCRNDDDCVLPGMGDAGTATRRYCDVGRRVCVQCRRDAECTNGQFCAGGECATGCSATRPCPTGQTCCGGACVDTRSNEGNCGACGRTCMLPNAAAVCRESTCVIGTCMDPFGDCDGRVTNGCETDLRNRANCGACDRACPVRPNATSDCDPTRRTCGFACNTGFEDCNARPEDGCEADIGTSVSSCGRCGQTCVLANATPSCTAGRCQVAACTTGFGDCDGNPANGCEVDVRSSVAHCGTCGRACAARPNAVASCTSGTCAYTCATGFLDCDSNPTNGCEVNAQTSATNCGTCGTVCRPANGTGRCAAGRCEVATCDTGFANCDGNAANGCETSLGTSLAHCGMCGRACAAGQVCVGGTCMVDCGGLTRCGSACADLQRDPLNCSRCGNVCPAGQSCIAGVCTLVCRAPEVNCDGSCVVTATNRNHCGRCGNVCPTPPNTTPNCTGGICGYGCNAGFSDCNGAASDGCEINSAGDARNCGGCGIACSFANAASMCVASLCTLGTCTAGFGNCDANPANGCEANLSNDARNCGRCGNVCPGACSAGACAPLTTIDRPQVINTLASPVVGTAGSRNITLVETGGVTIPVGSRVFLHQTQGSGTTAGLYEVNRVMSGSGTSLMLETPLRNTYTTSGASVRAQIVVFAQYTDVLLGPTGQLTAPEWNGRTGGILAVETTGDFIVQGEITMNGRGFRGNLRMCGPTAMNNCQYGFQGESWNGRGAQGPMANAGGGGGGGAGQDCGAGGGGAYGPGATNGSTGDCNSTATGECSMRCPNEGGAAGAQYGGGSLANGVYLGSAGGEGGADEDGGYPGAGGAGGGIIYMRVTGTLTVQGFITANGVDGLNGNQFACGGRGCGMGGGGGGAGGAVRLHVGRAVLGTGLVTATGGVGGQCSCRTVNITRAAPAGRGGNGRIGVLAPSTTGTTVPPFDPS